MANCGPLATAPLRKGPISARWPTEAHWQQCHLARGQLVPAGQLWPTGSCATAQGANCASWPSGAHWLLCHPLGLVCGPLHSIAPTGHPGPRATVPPQRPSGPPGNCAICTIGAADGLVGKICRRLLLRMPLRACVPVRACRARARSVPPAPATQSSAETAARCCDTWTHGG